MAKDKTKAQLETELADSEAARVLVEKRLAIATVSLRDIRDDGGFGPDRDVARTALTRMGNLRLRK